MTCVARYLLNYKRHVRSFDGDVRISGFAKLDLPVPQAMPYP